MDNHLKSTEQCFEIGLHCMVKEHTSLVHGSKIVFEAYVETNFNITSERETITLNVKKNICFLFCSTFNSIISF